MVVWIDIDPDLLREIQEQEPDLERVIREAMRHDDCSCGHAATSCDQDVTGSIVRRGERRSGTT